MMFITVIISRYVFDFIEICGPRDRLGHQDGRQQSGDGDGTKLPSL